MTVKAKSEHCFQSFLLEEHLRNRHDNCTATQPPLNRINYVNLRCDASVTGKSVTLENVKLGMQVARGRQWNPKKWRDDIVTTDKPVNANAPKRRSPGVIMGYTDSFGHLVGLNTNRKYSTDRVTKSNGPGWACVRWIETERMSIYPIGAQGVYSLVVKP